MIFKTKLLNTQTSVLPSHFSTFYYYYLCSWGLSRSVVSRMACSCTFLPKPVFSDITLVTWKWLWWEYLHYGIGSVWLTVFFILSWLKKVITMLIMLIKFKNILSGVITLWTLFKNKEMVLQHMRETIIQFSKEIAYATEEWNEWSSRRCLSLLFHHHLSG